MISGTVAGGFEPVRAEFAAVAAAADGGLSAQLAVYRDGERVADLWTGPQVTGDSLLGVFSATKGAAYLVVALLVQDGVLDLDRAVSGYWPEFAAGDKGGITVRELLAHRAGLVGADAGFTLAELADDRAVAQRLGAQRPYWRPGWAFGYHALVMGALAGEVVLRATGRDLREHFAGRVRDRHGAEVYLGLPAGAEDRFLATEPPPPLPARLAALVPGPASLNGIAFNRHHPQNPDLWRLPNFPVLRSRGPASVGGVASARGLARMYAAAISGVDGAEPLLTPATAAAFGQVHSAGEDLVTGDRKAYAVGFQATSEYFPELGQGSFGHSGAGGQQAFADPRHGLAYAYSRRRFPLPAGSAAENVRLIRAVYAAAARRSARPGPAARARRHCRSTPG